MCLQPAMSGAIMVSRLPRDVITIQDALNMMLHNTGRPTYTTNTREEPVWLQ